jgi:methyltransferase OMS1, mitochondrial
MTPNVTRFLKVDDRGIFADLFGSQFLPQPHNVASVLGMAPSLTLTSILLVTAPYLTTVHCFSTELRRQDSLIDRRRFLNDSSVMAAHNLVPTRTLPTIISIIVAATVLLAGRPAEALTPQQAERQYDTYARNYDALDGGTASSILGIEEARKELIGRAFGDVLEIGAGTGLNLPFWLKSDSITSLTLVDVSEGMLKEAKAKLTSSDLVAFATTKPIFPVRFIKADATTDLVALFGQSSFDTVVDSFSLCVMGDAGARACLQQMTQVVRPGTGQVLLLENSRADNPWLATYQDATASIIAANLGGKGCVYNQDVTAMIQATPGLRIVETTAFAGGVFRSYRCDKRSNGH